MRDNSPWEVWRLALSRFVNGGTKGCATWHIQRGRLKVAESCPRRLRDFSLVWRSARRRFFFGRRRGDGQSTYRNSLLPARSWPERRVALVPGDAGGAELLGARLEVLTAQLHVVGRRGAAVAETVGVVDRCASSPNARPMRTASLSADSCASLSFMRNSDCTGVVLGDRPAVVALVSALEDRQVRLLADPLLHEVDAALVRLVHRHERPVLRVSHSDSGGKGCSPPGSLSSMPPTASIESRISSADRRAARTSKANRYPGRSRHSPGCPAPKSGKRDSMISRCARLH